MCLALLIKLIQGFARWPALNPELKKVTYHKEALRGESICDAMERIPLVASANLVQRSVLTHAALPVQSNHLFVVIGSFG